MGRLASDGRGPRGCAVAALSWGGVHCQRESGCCLQRLARRRRSNPRTDRARRQDIKRAAAHCQSRPVAWVGWLGCDVGGGHYQDGGDASRPVLPGQPGPCSRVGRLASDDRGPRGCAVAALSWGGVHCQRESGCCLQWLARRRRSNPRTDRARRQDIKRAAAHCQSRPVAWVGWLGCDVGGDHCQEGGDASRPVLPSQPGPCSRVGRLAFDGRGPCGCAVAALPWGGVHCQRESGCCLQRLARRRRFSPEVDRTRHAGKMSNALRHIVNRVLSRGWAGWVATWEEATAKMAAMRRGLSYLINRDLARGWGGWRLMVEDRAAALSLLSRGVAFIVNAKAAAAFSMAGALSVARHPRTDRARRHDSQTRCGTLSIATCRVGGLAGLRRGRRPLPRWRRCVAACPTFSTGTLLAGGAAGV